MSCRAVSRRTSSSAASRLSRELSTRMARSRSSGVWPVGGACESRIFLAAAICVLTHAAGAGRIFNVRTLDTSSTGLPGVCICR